MINLISDQGTINGEKYYILLTYPHLVLDMAAMEVTFF